MTIQEAINSQLHNMTKSEFKIASYFLENSNAFAFETLDDIAEEIGTSTTSVIRFCRKMGYSGYKDFQNLVKMNVKSNLSLPDKFERVTENKPNNFNHSQLVKNVLNCIEQTFSNLPPELIESASKKVLQADRVFCFGLKESFALSHYAYTRFLTIRSNVFILSAGQSGEIESVLSLREGDACIFFLFHRYTNPAPEILKLLKKRGVTIILITSEPYDELEESATILLPCNVDINGIKNSSAAPVCLVDCICNCAAVYSEKNTLNYFKESEELFKNFTF